jgi:hypothetical protein
MRVPTTRQAHQTRLAAGRIRRSLDKPSGNYDHSEHQWGYVAAVHSFPPSVDLYLNGTQNVPDPKNITPTVKYLPWYVPTVGDIVLVYRGRSRLRSSRVVLGKLAGSPSPYPLPLGGISSSRYVSGPNALWGGAGAPPAGLGIDGDWYFRTDAAHIYQLQSGTWTEVV